MENYKRLGKLKKKIKEVSMSIDISRLQEQYDLETLDEDDSSEEENKLYYRITLMDDADFEYLPLMEDAEAAYKRCKRLSEMDYKVILESVIYANDKVEISPIVLSWGNVNG